jgi:hypothetical protein
MADDVLENAVPQQPAPNINKNDTKMMIETEQNNDNNYMEEEVIENEVSPNLYSYANSSTNSTVATNTATKNSNTFNNTSQISQLDCPSTPYTSNTTTLKHNSSKSGYLFQTPTNPPSKDLSVYDTNQLNINNSSVSPRRSLNRKNATPPTNTPPTPVPPITPFLLGQTIKMSSLQTALPISETVPTTLNQPDIDNEQADSISHSSMDTADVSNILKPKSIFNPYDKRHRNKPTTSNIPAATDTGNKSNEEPSYPLTNASTKIQTSNTVTNESVPLIPLMHHISTNSTNSNITNLTKPHETMDLVQDIPIDDLTQEEVEYITTELTKHEKQAAWTPVACKSPSRKEKSYLPSPNSTPKDSNPYSVLQDEDTDSDATIPTQTNPPVNTNENEVLTKNQANNQTHHQNLNSTKMNTQRNSPAQKVSSEIEEQTTPSAVPYYPITYKGKPMTHRFTMEDRDMTYGRGRGPRSYTTYPTHLTTTHSHELTKRPAAKVINPGRGGGLRPNTKSTLPPYKQSISANTTTSPNDSMDIDETEIVPATKPTQMPTPQSEDTSNTGTHNGETNQQPNQVHTNETSKTLTNSTNTNDLDDDDQKPPPNPSPKPSPKRTLAIKHQHTYRVFIKAFATEKDQETFNRLEVLNIVLKAMQKCDPVTSLIIPCDDQFQKRIYTVINPTSKNKKGYEKIEQLLNYTSNNMIQGTVQITSNTIYSTIKKNFDTKKMLQEKFQISLYRNNFKATNLSEVGFFANHLVRHDTVECTRWITDRLPQNTPNFQSELTPVWAGPPKERKVAGVLKIYAEREDVQTLADLLRNIFKNPNHTRFIPKEYFDTLNPQEKAAYITSQYEYQKLYRSVIVKGVKNPHIPTTVTNNNIPLSIMEWLLTVPDYKHENMFLQHTEVNNNEIELKCLETNLHIAKKWARNALYHISKILQPVQFTSAFNDVDALTKYHHTEDWNPPPPPIIQFMPDPKNAWKKDIPKTITRPDVKKTHIRKKQSAYSRSSTNTYEKENDNDNNTLTTVNTQASYTQDTISELQNNSYQHQQMLDTHNRRIDVIDATIVNTLHYQQLVDAHGARLEEIETNAPNVDRRLDTIDRQIQERLSALTSNLATLEEEQQIQQRHQEQMARDIERNASQLPTITENMESQQKQLIKYFRRQNKINRQTDNELKKLRATQSTHETMITTLQAIVLQLQNSSPATPLSQQRVRKRPKPKNHTETSIQEDSEMDSDSEPNELHQMHAISSLQNHSIEQLSFIHPQVDDSAVDDDLIPWEDVSSGSNESNPDLSYIATQDQDSDQDDLGETDPGQHT